MDPNEKADVASEQPEPGSSHEKDPQDTTPRGNGPLDEEALEKGRESLESVKPY